MSLKEIMVSTNLDTEERFRTINTSYVICIECGYNSLGTQLFLKDYGWLYSSESYDVIRDKVLGRTDEERNHQ